MGNLILLTVVVLATGSLVAFAQDVEPPEGFRVNRTTYSPLMDKLASSRAVAVTDAQLAELKTLQLEAIWDGLGDYQATYVLGFRTTQTGSTRGGARVDDAVFTRETRRSPGSRRSR